MPSLLIKKQSLLKAKQNLQPRLRIKKPKLLRSNPTRKSFLLIGRDVYDTVDDEDIVPVVYRRPEFTGLLEQIDDMDISDEIKFRLFLARVKALEKYNEVNQYHVT